MVIHGKYTINFCRKGVQWQHQAMVIDLRKANKLGPDVGVVLHQGKNLDSLHQTREEARQTFVSEVEKVLSATVDISNPIILENSCHQGTEIGYSLDELAEIWGLFKNESRKRLGFCLDTCHVFVAGDLQMKDHDDVDQWFQRFDSLIGLKYLKLIHFNDSNVKFNGHNDNHDDIGQGYITNPTKGGIPNGLSRVVAWAKTYEIPLILEVPGECTEQIELLNSWANEAPIITLPKTK